MTQEEYAATCDSIAREIAGLASRYVQLASFPGRADATCHFHYAYHTHAPQRRGGWTSGVPNPDEDGIWFHIRIWDPADPSEATAQINTQPGIPSWWIGKRRVTYLILEGAKTDPVMGEIKRILERHGMVEQREPPPQPPSDAGR